MYLDSLRFGVRYSDAGIATRSLLCDLVHYNKATVYASLV